MLLIPIRNELQIITLHISQSIHQFQMNIKKKPQSFFLVFWQLKDIVTKGLRKRDDKKQAAP